MRQLHATVLRGLPGPFLAAFGILLFLLLMQFLIRYLPDLVGRGLPVRVLVELITYSLAYMVTLAGPMAVLLATLAAFGKLAESRAYAVTRSAGISLWQLAWPALVVGGMASGGMAYFNSVLLPEANFRMGSLWIDIRAARPGFLLEPGVFYTGIDGYGLRVEQTDPRSNRLDGVTVYDHRPGTGSRSTTTAAWGELAAADSGRTLLLTLYGGEMHRTASDRGAGTERYERFAFERHRMRLDLSDLAFSRADRSDRDRTDRTMRASQLAALVDSLDAAQRATRDALRARLITDAARPPAEPPRLHGASKPTSTPAALVPPPAALAPDTVRRASPHPALDGLAASAQHALAATALNDARAVRVTLDQTANTLEWERERANRYRVELYKKYSMAAACLVFVLIGIPIGLAVPRWGVGRVGTLAVVLFLFYWITLNQGEKLADRGLLEPVAGMWGANALVGLLAALLFWREQRAGARR